MVQTNLILSNQWNPLIRDSNIFLESSPSSNPINPTNPSSDNACMGGFSGGLAALLPVRCEGARSAPEVQGWTSVGNAMDGKFPTERSEG